YLSPEHGMGRPAGKRADIWAFGIVLHEMLAGRRPLDGVVGLPATTPSPVRHLVERCLDRDPRQRLRDIGEARIVLDDRTIGSRAPATASDGRAPGRRGWTRWLAAAALVTAGAIAGLASWPASRGERPATATRFPLTLAADQLLVVPTPH